MVSIAAIGAPWHGPLSDGGAALRMERANRRSASTSLSSTVVWGMVWG